MELKELAFADPKYKESSKYHKYKIKYDSKGRIDTISYMTVDDYKNETDPFVVFYTIDYDRKTIALSSPPSILSPESKTYYYYRFSTNEKGIITKMNNYVMTYNDEGYLTNVKGPELFELVYYEDDLYSLIKTLNDKQSQYDWYETGDGDSKREFCILNFFDNYSNFIKYVMFYSFENFYLCSISAITLLFSLFLELFLVFFQLFSHPIFLGKIFL